MDFTEFWIAALFGLVEGITEWLPISSTGHMILLNELITLPVSDAFYKMFEVVIQLGAILAVVVLFWNQIFPFKKHCRRPMKKTGLLSCVDRDILILWVKILTACIPAGVIGVLFDDVFDPLFYNPFSVASALIVFGIAFIVIENVRRHTRPQVTSLDELTLKHILIIGVFQLIAGIFPGTSRSGATIVGALLIGIDRSTAAEFTFFLAVPVMFGASLLKLIKFGLTFTASEVMILMTGMTAAFLVSLLIIRFLMAYIRRHDFKIFGWYRIALGLTVFITFLILR